MLLSRAGTGPATFELAASDLTHKKVTVRLSCVGEGKARVSDAAGRLFIGLGGCSSYAVYGAGPVAGRSSDRVLTLTVSAATRWRIAVYLS